MLELAGILVFGIAAQWLAWRMGVPAILPLILIGLLVGPISTLFTPDGAKLITPIFDGDKGLFPGNLLFNFDALAIGIILFEGGLTLKRAEIKGVGSVIIRLISLGSAVTFTGGALAAYFIVGLSWPLAFLFSALIIVTGPTVIAPILRNIPLKRDISTVLKWEGILIDPIGALVAVLVFNFISSGGGTFDSYSSEAFGEFSKIIVVGMATGFSMAYFLRWMLQGKFIPHYLLNVFTLAVVVFAFAFSDVIVHESGLLTVVVMGMVLGNMDLPELREILYFKESLSIMLISILFILLSANIDMKELQALWHWQPILLFFIVILVLRPMAVFLSTTGSALTIADKSFISWVGPRGIVAAGIASLFGTALSRAGVAGAEMITPLVFMIVLGTVILNAASAKFVAARLGVLQAGSDGFLLVGASLPARLVARFLADQGRHVVLVDTNPANVRSAIDSGLDAIEGNIYSENISDDLDLLDVGHLIAMTGSPVVNDFAIDSLRMHYGEHGAQRLISSDEIREIPEHVDRKELLIPSHDYIQLTELVRSHPHIFTIEYQSEDKSRTEAIKHMMDNREQAPFAILSKDEELSIFSAAVDVSDLKDGDVIAYIGKEIEVTAPTAW